MLDWLAKWVREARASNILLAFAMFLNVTSIVVFDLFYLSGHETLHVVISVFAALILGIAFSVAFARFLVSYRRKAYGVEVRLAVIEQLLKEDFLKDLNASDRANIEEVVRRFEEQVTRRIQQEKGTDNSKAASSESSTAQSMAKIAELAAKTIRIASSTRPGQMANLADGQSEAS